jgi:hypothetical protein
MQQQHQHHPSSSCTQQRRQQPQPQQSQPPAPRPHSCRSRRGPPGCRAWGCQLRCHVSHSRQGRPAAAQRLRRARAVSAR